MTQRLLQLSLKDNNVINGGILTEQERLKGALERLQRLPLLLVIILIAR
jgi:hypothetical protein